MTGHRSVVGEQIEKRREGVGTSAAVVSPDGGSGDPQAGGA